MISKAFNKGVWNTLLFFIFTGVIHSEAISQSRKTDPVVNATVGGMFKVPKDGYINNMIQLKDGGYLVISTVSRYTRLFGNSKSRANRHYKVLDVHHLDSNLEETDKKFIDLVYGDKRMDYHSIHETRSGHYMFMTFDNIQRGKVYLFAARFNPNTLTFDSDPVMIGSQRRRSKRMETEAVFIIKANRDQEVFSILSIPPQDRKAIQRAERARRTQQTLKRDNLTTYVQMDIWAYNEGLELVNYRGDYQFELEESKGGMFYLKEVIHDEQGNMYILGSDRALDLTTSSYDFDRNDEAGFRYYIKKLNTDGTENNFIPEAPSTIIHARVAINPHTGLLVFAGITGPIVFAEPYSTGVYRINFNADLTISDDMEYAYDDKLYDKENIAIHKTRTTGIGSRRSVGGRQREKDLGYDEIPDRYLPNAFAVQAIHFDTEGNPVIVIEEQWLEVDVDRSPSYGTGTSSTTTYTYYYYYGNLHACKLLPSGTMESATMYKLDFAVNQRLPRGFASQTEGNRLVFVADLTAWSVDMESLEVSKSQVQLFNKRGKTKKFRVTSRKKTGPRNRLQAKRLTVHHYLTMPEGQFVYIDYYGKRTARLVGVKL